MSTYEGSAAWAALHALPVETAKPAASSASSSLSASPSNPAKAKHACPGSRQVAIPQHVSAGDAFQHTGDERFAQLHQP